MAKGKKHIDYRAVKKVLNWYFDFGFKTPRKGKDFTPQQKAAITRKFQKIAHLIDNQGEVEHGLSFIPYPKNSKLPGVDAIRTNKGIFYKLPGAKAVRDKKGKYKIVVKVGQRKDIFFPFPKSIINSIDKIRNYVDVLRLKHKPDAIRWSTAGRRQGNIYAPQIFEKYVTIGDEENTELDKNEIDEIETEIDLLDEFIGSIEFDELPNYEKHEHYRKLSFLRKRLEQPSYYNGVFFTWFKNGS